MNRFKLALVYILLVPWSLSSQLDSMHRFKMVSGLSKFRDELMADTNKALAFGVLSAEAKRIAKIRNYGPIFNYMWPDLYFMEMNERYPHRYSSYFDSNSIFSKNNINVDQINNENHYLRSSINYGFYEREYPFKIKNNMDIERELEFLDIQENDCIFDYGPGMMCLAPILCSIYDSITVYQALSGRYFGHVYNDNFISHFNSFKNGSQNLIIEIAPYTVPVFNGLYDLIFINFPIQINFDIDKLIIGIKQSLKKDGNLIIMHLHGCEGPHIQQLETLSYSKILNKLRKSGFTIEKSLDLKCKYLYKCKIVPVANH